MPDLRTLPPGWELPRGARGRLLLARVGARLHQHRQAEVAATVVLLAVLMIIAIGLIFTALYSGPVPCKLVPAPGAGRTHLGCGYKP